MVRFVVLMATAGTTVVVLIARIAATAGIPRFVPDRTRMAAG